MTKRFYCSIVFIISNLLSLTVFAQSDSLKKNLTVSFGIEPYFGYAFQNNSKAIFDMSTNYHLTDAFSINLAYMEFKYEGSKLRGKLIPGFGTYMDVNYASEFGLFKNVMEASAGYLLNPKLGIWLDIGILSAPFTNETAFARDHIMLTRSVCAENSPYYITGARLSCKLNENTTIFGYLVNGWQNIQENNPQKAGIFQLEYKENNKLVFNWNFYAGYEGNNQNPADQERLFSDAYIIYKGSKKLSYTACILGGRQYRSQNNKADFFSGNLAVNYQLFKPLSVSGRIERMSDVRKAITNQNILGSERGKISNSFSLGLNYQPQKEVLYRLECRRFFGINKLFDERSNEPTEITWVVAAANFLF